MSIILIACPFLVVLMALWASSAMAEVGDMMYWTSERGIARWNMHSGSQEWIVEADLRRPGGIAIDEAEGKIYWTHFDWGYPGQKSTTYRSNLDGSDLEAWNYNGGNGLVNIDIDPQDRKIYSTGYAPGSDTHGFIVGGSALDAPDDWSRSFRSQANGLGLYGPYEVVMDPIRRKLYFIDVEGLKSLDILPDSEGAAEMVYLLEEMTGYRDNGSPQGVFDLEMDYMHGVIYWSATGGIGRSRLADGKEGISLFMEVPAQQIAIDSEKEEIYWAKDGEIFRTTLEGLPSDLVVDVPGFRDEMAGEGVSGLPWEATSNIVDMAVYEGRIFWSDLAGTLRSCDRDGKDLQTLFAPTVRSPSGIFADSKRGRILWGDRLSGSVFEAGLDGSDLRVIASESLDVSDVLATDGRLYWSDNATGEIWSSNLDGSDAEPVIQLGESFPVVSLWPPMSIAYDSVRERVCWQAMNIYCASQDGSDIELLVDGLDRPLYDIAVDGQQELIYWADEKGLWRIDSDGGERESLYRDPPGFLVWDRTPIALARDRVYWMTWQSSPLGPLQAADWVSLHRLDRDEIDAHSVYIEHFLYGRNNERPESIALYLPARTAVHHLSEPSVSALHSNYPNPFNGETRIPYTVSRDGQVTLTIYNALGQPVASLANGMHSRGAYEAVWDTEGHESLASGVYLARLVAGDVVKIRKLTLLR